MDGLAQIKTEGSMSIYDEGGTLPKLSKHASSIVWKGSLITRKEYNAMLIKQQPFF